MEEQIGAEPQFEEMTPDDAASLKNLLTKFITSYENKPESVSDRDWLKARFVEELNLPDKKAAEMADETLSGITDFQNNLSSINAAAEEGISKERWFADKVSKAASGAAIAKNCAYLSDIDTALTNANAQMARTVSTNTGDISHCFNLDGFIAEQHHVNSFNANAALQKSKFFAEVKVPGPGETYGKNSFDVVIRDSTNPHASAVHQYQVKYGADAQKTIQLLRDHGSVTKYSNQTILVPPEQVAEVQKAFPGKTVVSQIGGTDRVPVASSPLTKDQAKKLQFKAQNEHAVPRTGWNDYNVKSLTTHIGEQAALSSMQAALITTGVSLSSQIIKGEGVDVQETVKLALTTGADTGLKTAITGAIKVGVEKGFIGIIPQGTPPGVIANIVCVSVETVKILHKAATGKITMAQATDEIGRLGVTMTYGMTLSIIGTQVGAAAFSWIPVVGPIIGGTLGGIIGYMAGSTYGQAIYKGYKAIRKTAENTCAAVRRKLRDSFNRFRQALTY